MLTDKDIQRIMAVVATKDDLQGLVSKAHFDEFVHENFALLDGIAKSIDDLKMEYVAIKVQLDRHERWIKELAEKTGLKLAD